jgi:L-iditol 2-dehydrogenase
MQALRYYQPGKIEVEDIPRPLLNPGEILVRAQACGVCATDIKTFLRGHPKFKPGIVLGHEMTGIIEEVNQVEQWQPGMRVAVAPYVPCYNCDQCARGNFTQCEYLMDQAADPGGFAEYVRIPPRLVKYGLAHLPDALSLVDASLSEPLGCVIHGMEALKIEPRDSLLIIGDGTMGLLQAEAARALGVHQIILSGATPARLARAARVADLVIDASQEDVYAAIQKACPGGANKVLVSVGSGEVAQSAFRLVHNGGMINLFAGLPKETELKFNPALVHYDEVTILGTFGFTPNHFHAAVKWLAEKKIATEGIITGTYPLAEARAAFQDAAELRGIKSIITMGGFSG